MLDSFAHCPYREPNHFEGSHASSRAHYLGPPSPAHVASPALTPASNKHILHWRAYDPSAHLRSGDLAYPLGFPPTSAYLLVPAYPPNPAYYLTPAYCSAPTPSMPPSFAYSQAEEGSRQVWCLEVWPQHQVGHAYGAPNPYAPPPMLVGSGMDGRGQVQQHGYISHSDSRDCKGINAWC